MVGVGKAMSADNIDFHRRQSFPYPFSTIFFITCHSPLIVFVFSCRSDPKSKQTSAVNRFRPILQERLYNCSLKLSWDRACSATFLISKC